MSNRNKGTRNRFRKANRRIQSLEKSFDSAESGGLTVSAAKMIAQALGGRSTECTITAHCRTSVYEFPGSRLVAEEPVGSELILSHPGFKASIVSDLRSYFGQRQADSLHYAIDVSLKHEVHVNYEKAIEESRQKVPSEVPSSWCWSSSTRPPLPCWIGASVSPSTNAAMARP